jgi:anti-sigma factor RsiW
MSCSPFDLKDYFLQELADPGERQQVEAHVRVCQPCREELERLRLTEAALFALRDEEIPQRIAFVSDKVFEPSLLRRWLAGFWGSAARLGFASAAMLSVALIVFATTRPAPAPASGAGPSAAAIEQRVQAAADTAARAIEARYAEKTEQLVKAIQERDQKERRLMMASYETQSNYQQNKIASLEMEKRMNSISAMASNKDGQ